MKKIIALLLIAALAAPVAAFAEEAAEDIMLISAEEDIMLIGEEEEGVEVPVSEEEGQTEAHAMYVKQEVTNAELSEDGTTVKGIDANGEEIDFVLNNVMIMSENGSKIALANGDSFTAFIAWDKPAPLVMPPVYYPDVIVIDTNEELTVDMDVYTKTEDSDTYTNAAGTLSIYSEDDVDGKTLVVVYGATTMSIPPIAVDPTVYSFEVSEQEPSNEADVAFTAVAVGDKTFEVEMKNEEIGMLPVRAVAEALGLEVAWDGTLNAVTVGTVQMGVNFNLGENSYKKSKMMPFVLESAPVVEQTEEGGVTFVPVSFFTEVLGCVTEVADGVANLIFN